MYQSHQAVIVSLRSKRFTSRYCAKVGARAKEMEDEREGEVFFSALPFRGHSSFLALSSQLSRPIERARKRLLRRLSNNMFFVAEKHTV